MSKMKYQYILEVVKYLPETSVDDRGCIIFSKHEGYMSKIFKTPKDADKYYKIYNPHMRSIMAHEGLCSDWDPDTHLMYIIRRYHGHEYLGISNFEGKFDADPTDFSKPN